MAIWCVRKPQHQDAAPRCDGGRRAEVDELLRAAGLLAEPRGAAHGPSADSQRHVRRRRAATAPKVLRDNAAQGLPAGRDHNRGDPQGPRLRDRHGRQVAPRAAAGSFCRWRRASTHWFGLPYSHDMRMTAPRENGYKSAAYYDPKPEYWDVPLMRNGEVIERPVDHRTLTKRYTEEAVRFINANRARPFFLYLAHSLPHIPLARSPEFVGHSGGRHLRRRDRGDRLEHRPHPRRAEERRASTGARWSCSRATTDRGCRSATTAARRVRSGKARARRGRAACGRRRSSGGRERCRHRWSPISDRRWTCS